MGKGRKDQSRNSPKGYQTGHSIASLRVWAPSPDSIADAELVLQQENNRGPEGKTTSIPWGKVNPAHTAYKSMRHPNCLPDSAQIKYSYF